MAKDFSKIICQGAKIVYKSIYKSILQEIDTSREAAKQRYNTSPRKTDGTEDDNYNLNHSSKMSLDEAKLILNVKNLNAKEVEDCYNHLFEANNKCNGGSFYIQSKVFRAKQRIDFELSKIDGKNTRNKNIITAK